MQFLFQSFFILILLVNPSSFLKSINSKTILVLVQVGIEQKHVVLHGSLSSCIKKRKVLTVKQPKALKVNWKYDENFQPKPEDAWNVNLSIPNDGELELNLLSEKLELLQVRKMELKKGKHNIRVVPIITTPAEEAYVLELRKKFGSNFQLNSTFNGLTYLYPGNFVLQVKFQNQVEALSLELVANN